MKVSFAAAMLCLALVGLVGRVGAGEFAFTPFAAENAPEVAGLTAAAQSTALGRGVNLGGLLDAPSEGAWGLTLSEEMFAAVAAGGFDTIRLPVRFSNHAGATEPYALDEAFMQRVDFAVRQALGNGLRIIIDFHHYHQMDGDPLDDGEFSLDLTDQQVIERYKALWKQIAERYRGLPNDRVLFELYNEPHGETALIWNTLLAETLEVVRASNPDRFVLIDPVNWSTPSGLAELRLPAGDKKLIVDVHTYEPYHFTMQGAPWIEGSEGWRGTTCCSTKQLRAMTGPLDMALKWSKKNRRPIILGEFGSNSEAPYADRVRYTARMREAAEERGFSWAYWDFASGEFGPWDPATNSWRPELRDSLVPPK